MHNSIITLTTDFGLKDPYVAEMKAVILNINPKVTIVDISHHIRKFNIRAGAFVLASATPYFPKGTIHVAVVDPGVGTERQPILVQTKRACFVGPDNGMLGLAVKTMDGKMRVRRITNQKLMLSRVSNTFHGRDIFAPAAAHLTNGTPPEEFGPETEEISMPDFAKVVRREGVLIGEVIHIDNFGNIVTNIGKKELRLIRTRKTVSVVLKSVKHELKFCKNYGEVKKQQPLALIGSHGLLEISTNQGNAAEVFNIENGDKIVLNSS